MNDEGAKMLASAICKRAVDDYRKIGKKLAKAKKNKKREELRCELKVIEKFFYSDWFLMLSGIDGEYVVEQLRKEIVEED